MNFGETLAYWYLRLNGFFPLANFVIHRGNPGLRSGADVDLVAVRPPHVFEPIGGGQEDWDLHVFADWGIPITEAFVGLIVEVRTGAFNSRHLRNAFSDERVEYASSRIGFWPTQNLKQVVEGLSSAPLISSNDSHYFIAKLLISIQEPSNRI